MLSIFHYVVGGIIGLMGCFPFIHLAIGIAIVSGKMNNGGDPEAAFGWIFILFASFMIAMMWATAIAVIVAGRKLSARTSYTFCLVMAGIECMFMPFGTVLGVFTIIVLVRPSVKEQFGLAS